METTKEMIEVMQAFEDGKTIQQTFEYKWVDTICPNWDWLHSDYRIKPEPKKPTYRPYESVAEMLCDYKRRVCKVNNQPKNTMPLIWVKLIGFPTDKGTLITSYDDNKVWLGGVDVSHEMEE